MNQGKPALLMPLKGGDFLALAAGSLFCALCAVLVRGLALGEKFSNLSFVVNLNWVLFFSVACAAACVMIVFAYLFNSAKPLSIVLLTSSFCFALLTACNSETDILFYLGLCLPFYFVLRWAMQEKNDPFGRAAFGMKSTLIFAAVLFVGFTLLVSYLSILRYRTYNATNFDLGIFAQMFEQLRKTGHAVTTLERNRLLTHFGVHCSPVFYLILPVYWLFPRIETLLVVQAAAVGAGVFAVRGIARHCFGESPRLVVLSCLLFICNPSFAFGCLYDFHENKFLTVFVLFAVYFLLRQRAVPALIFSLLTLSVKEDAAIYVVSLALFLLVAQRWKDRRRQMILGGSMIVLSVLWFLGAALVVQHYGSGVMTDRLRNYFLPLEGQRGFADVIMVLVSNLGYVITQVFTAEKVQLMLWLFLPLGFAPFFRKKGGDWLLLLPALVINLLSNYGYQSKIGYQYTFGSFALAIPLALLGLRDCKPRLRRGVLLFAVMASVLCSAALMSPKFSYFTRSMSENAQRIAAVDEILAALPEEAEITATTWFAVHLYQRDRVYMYPNFYAAQEVTEYLLCKPEEASGNDTLQAFLAEHYVLQQAEAFVEVYVLK